MSHLNNRSPFSHSSESYHTKSKKGAGLVSPEISLLHPWLKDGHLLPVPSQDLCIQIPGSLPLLIRTLVIPGMPNCLTYFNLITSLKTFSSNRFTFWGTEGCDLIHEFCGEHSSAHSIHLLFDVYDVLGTMPEPLFSGLGPSVFFALRHKSFYSLSQLLQQFTCPSFLFFPKQK
jgi:hypothetical protein